MRSSQSDSSAVDAEDESPIGFDPERLELRRSVRQDARSLVADPHDVITRSHERSEAGTHLGVDIGQHRAVEDDRLGPGGHLGKQGFDGVEQVAADEMRGIGGRDRGSGEEALPPISIESVRVTATCPSTSRPAF